MLAKVGIAIAVEVGYALVTRVWLPSQLSVVEREVAITAIRALTIPMYCALFLDVVRSRRKLPSTRPTLLFALGITLVCLGPALTHDWRASTVATRVLFGVTSIVVAVREELVYRGVLQNLLQRRLGWMGAIVVSNVVFTAYHYGAWRFTVFRALTVLLVGGVLGILYYGTGYLRIPIMVHAAYDALASLSPLVPQPLPPIWATAFQLAALATLARWLRRRRLV